jgi:ferredoxin--NADP+ reductase
MKNEQSIHRLIKKYYLNATTYVLRMTRNDLKFKAGQTISVGIHEKSNQREYSIYSGEADDYLEILIKKVDDGQVSNELETISEETALQVRGPGGFFTLIEDKPKRTEHFFIASGTGISPFRSMIRTQPNLEYKVIHGIRTMDEAYGKEYVPQDRYITCTSRDHQGVFSGRLTNYLNRLDLRTETKYYICGNSSMIFDAFDILKKKSIDSRNIITEVYF